MPQRCVVYYHLTWLTSPPIWWDSIGKVAIPPDNEQSITQFQAGVNRCIITLPFYSRGNDGISWRRMVFILKLNR
jgi:hypothetical protein